jgi:hypothetical protein
LTSDLATKGAGHPNPDGLAFEVEQDAMPSCQSEHALSWCRGVVVSMVRHHASNRPASFLADFLDNQQLVLAGEKALSGVP